MKKSVLIISVIFVIVIISNTHPFQEIASPYIETLANVAAAGGLIALFFQFKRERDLNEADFLLRLNQDFMTNESISRIYKILEKSKNEGQKTNPFNQEDIIDMANYLSYFEPFHSLMTREILKIDSIDPVIAYRFFIATNNKFMQQMLLCVENKESAWESIYRLYSLWVQYRKKTKRELWQNDFALSKSNCYKKIITDSKY